MARTLIGKIVSDKMDKTAVVAVDRQRKHAKYQKYYTVTKRYKAYDGENKYKEGDVVVIAESRPLSKDKRWTITGLASEKKTA